MIIAATAFQIGQPNARWSRSNRPAYNKKSTPWIGPITVTPSSVPPDRFTMVAATRKR